MTYPTLDEELKMTTYYRDEMQKLLDSTNEMLRDAREKPTNTRLDELLIADLEQARKGHEMTIAVYDKDLERIQKEILNQN